MTKSALIEWKRMKAIELRLRSTMPRGETSPLQTELYEAATAFASAFAANLTPTPRPEA